jgi:hypothetical protein
MERVQVHITIELEAQGTKERGKPDTKSGDHDNHLMSHWIIVIIYCLGGDPNSIPHMSHQTRKEKKNRQYSSKFPPNISKEGA